jgi:hypothetical protein
MQVFIAMSNLVKAMRQSPRPAFFGFGAGSFFARKFGFSAFCLVPLLLAGFLAALDVEVVSPAQVPSHDPSISYTKVLKGSSPEFLSLRIGSDGQGTYDSHKLADPSSPRPMQISAATTAQIFSLMRSLQDFRGLDLDKHQKVANLGFKTLTYQNGQETATVQFNYSEDRSVQQLIDLLEMISSVEERITQLEYSMKYDRLNLPQILLQIQGDIEDGYYTEASLLIPTLEKISSDPHYLHLAQARAREIESRIHRKK